MGNNDDTLLIVGLLAGLILGVISLAITDALTDSAAVMLVVFFVVLGLVVLITMACIAENVRIRNEKIEQSSFPRTIIGLNNSLEGWDRRDGVPSGDDTSRLGADWKPSGEHL